METNSTAFNMDHSDLLNDVWDTDLVSLNVFFDKI